MSSEVGINSYQEIVFYHYILGDMMLTSNTKSEYFSSPILKELFDISKEHTLKYKSPPSKEQLSEIVRIKGAASKINEDIITTIYNTKEKLAEYDSEWLDNNVKPWLQVRNLDSVMRKAISYMKMTKITPENASETVETIRGMLLTETALNFDFNIGSDFFNPASHLQTRLDRTSTGYSYMDTCLKGGFWKGSLIVILSGPKAGKSTFLGNLAANSVQLGHNTAYISFELQEELVNMRLGSNLLNIKLDTYEETAKDQVFLRERMTSVKQNSIVPLGALHVKEFAASTCSTVDLRNYLKKTEEILGIHFDTVFVDYINIMKNWRNPNTENSYMKIKQIAEDLRAMAIEGQWAIVSATQTGKQAWDTNDLVISNVSESAALLHTVDALFGLITNPEMKARNEYFVKCLANRVAGFENTRKRYTIDWNYARIDEDRNSPIQDMDFSIPQFGNHNQNHTSYGNNPGSSTYGKSMQPEETDEYRKIAETKDLFTTK